MNVRGRDVLLIAFMKSQCEGTLVQTRDPRFAFVAPNGFCTLGLLLSTVGCGHLMIPPEAHQGAILHEHQGCAMRVMQQYEITPMEWNQIRDQNTTMDWLTIAWLHSREPLEQPGPAG